MYDKYRNYRKQWEISSKPQKQKQHRILLTASWEYIQRKVSHRMTGTSTQSCLLWYNHSQATESAYMFICSPQNEENLIYRNNETVFNDKVNLNYAICKKKWVKLEVIILIPMISLMWDIVLYKHINNCLGKQLNQ